VRVKLTDRWVRALAAPAARLDVWDELVPGLVLRVTPAGMKTFALWYRVHGRPRRYTFGRYPTVSLADAREQAQEILAGARRGEDAQAAKLEARAAADFEGLCRSFVGARTPNLATSTAREYARMINAYVRGSALARTPAQQTTSLDLDARLNELAKDAPIQANRLFQLFRAVCRWGRRKGALPMNPMEAVERPRREQPRERTLRDDEVRALLQALTDSDPDFSATRPPDAITAAAVQVLLLLGQRSTETLEMRWQDLDLKGRPATPKGSRSLPATLPIWTIPGRYRKGGRLHTVPLPHQVVTIIEALHTLTGNNARVFHGVSIDNPHRWWDPIRDRAIGLGKREGVVVEHFTRHDLRRTAATGMTRLGASRFIADRVIGHKETGVASVYDRYEYLREKASALGAWAAHVEAIGSRQGREATILPMRGSGAGR
jgi:integrase